MIDALPLLLGSDEYQISRSVRLRSSASAYFNRTPASAASNGQRWTYSGWVKRGTLGAVASILAADAGGGTSGGLYFDTDNTLKFGTGATLHKTSAAVFRDPSAWYHIVVVADSTQATGANRLLLYVNGVPQTWTSGTDPTLNGIWLIGKQSTLQGIGFAVGSAASTYFDGYLTEINFIDGQSLPAGLSNWAQAFGETDIATGVWKPKKYVGTYGNNGFYLNFSDPSAATAAAIGKDYSGNGNNWTPNNISVTAGVTYDSMLDVPTPWADGGNGRGNYAVLNPLDTFSSSTLSRANLQQAAALGGYRSNATIRVPASGKWYAEFINSSAWSASIGLGFGVSTEAVALNGGSGASGSYHFYASGVAAIVNNGSATTISSITNSANQTFQLAVDVDNGKVWIGQNNTWYNSSGGSTGDPSTGANPSFTISPAGFKIFTYIDSNSTVNWNANFGQRPFAYTPPSGFNALNTFNLPEPSIDDGRLYMAATTYTGTGASLSVNNTVNNVSFQPDFVWVKGRSGATDHALYDAVRGVQLQLESNTTTAETTETTGLTAFNSNGFTVGALAQMNTNTATYVGWQWKEGATQGFDIVLYTGNGANRTIAHNLGVAPKMVIVKNRTAGGAGYWLTWHANMTSASYYLALNLTAAQTLDATVWNSTAPTSSVFSLGTNTTGNNSGTDFVAYLFAEVAGFSRFGSYIGNGSADGPFVFCGFRPRWIMTKLSSAAGGGWWIYDTARDTFNATNDLLQANLSNASATGLPFDILSNGFKIRTSNVGANTSGATFIFAAFAENPFKYSLAR